MGVDARIVVYAPDKTTAENACAAAFARIADLDSMMSDYRQNSELMKLCAHSGGPATVVSSDLFLVLKRSQEFAKLTDGLFDITAGPLIQIWRKARKTHTHPSAQQIAQAKQKVGWKFLQLVESSHTARLMKEDMKLDLGAIAKGFADDEGQAVLKKFGIKSALIEMGGDIVVSDPPPGTKGWTIEVPNAGLKGKADEMLFANCAISSSGDTEQFVVLDGKKYSHVVNPKTGYALTEGVQSTVIARDGLTSDPLSTATTLVSSRTRARLLKHFLGSREYVRVVKKF